LKFELIDRVIEQSDTHIKAVKCVSTAEEYLADHFPGFPVLPGVLMLETLVQAARLLVASRTCAIFATATWFAPGKRWWWK
jgi:3-hydroxyacyl-[acyl-carrier-protein] dehydratase